MTRAPPHQELGQSHSACHCPGNPEARRGLRSPGRALEKRKTLSCQLRRKVTRVVPRGHSGGHSEASPREQEQGHLGEGWAFQQGLELESEARSKVPYRPPRSKTRFLQPQNERVGLV